MKQKLEKIAEIIKVAADSDVDGKKAVIILREIKKIEALFKNIDSLAGKMSKDGQKDFAKKLDKLESAYLDVFDLAEMYVESKNASIDKD